MDPISNRSSPVLTEPATINKSRSLCLHSNVLPRSAPAAYSPGLHLTIPRKKAVILDDVRSSGWLDSMKSSSPPPKKSKDTDGDIMEDDLDDAYRTWMLKYPSALTSFDQITAFAKGKRIALFLDYDGTLSPIVDNPDLAFMSESMRAVVRKVAKCFPTAIISGRSRDKVFEFVKLNELYYAGSHGMDIMGPRRYHFSSDRRGCTRSTEKQGKGVYLFQPASEFLLMIDEVYKSLVGLTKNIRGVRVEHNMFCTSVHYRNVDEKNWTVVAKCVQDALKYYPRLYMTHGRKVLEIRPKINWDKGKAVMFLLQSLGSFGLIYHVMLLILLAEVVLVSVTIVENMYCRIK